MSMKKHMKTMVRIMFTLTLLFALCTAWAFAEDQAVEVKATDGQEESVDCIADDVGGPHDQPYKKQTCDLCILISDIDQKIINTK